MALVLSRGDDDFSDAERDLLDRARPFLVQVYRNAVEHSALLRASAGALEASLIAEGLTTKQAKVLCLVAHGGSDRAVAARLGISERTVHKHLEHAFRALGVHNRSDAAARAWRLIGR
jgi:DNA-binding NarL/FixJ family response regulator